MTPPYIADLEAEAAETLRIELPWPDKRLSPNARLHWRAKAALTKKARADTAVLALEAAGASLSAIRRAMAGEGPIPVVFEFYAPDRRHRDQDNIIASTKAVADGLADALRVNDRRFTPSHTFGLPEAPGKIIVELIYSVPGFGEAG
jgi:crossover junction endodeoxyribonuclease RusA